MRRARPTKAAVRESVPESKSKSPTLRSKRATPRARGGAEREPAATKRQIEKRCRWRSGLEIRWEKSGIVKCRCLAVPGLEGRGRSETEATSSLGASIWAMLEDCSVTHIPGLSTEDLEDLRCWAEKCSRDPARQEDEQEPKLCGLRLEDIASRLEGVIASATGHHLDMAAKNRGIPAAVAVLLSSFVSPDQSERNDWEGRVVRPWRLKRELDSLPERILAGWLARAEEKLGQVGNTILSSIEEHERSARDDSLKMTVDMREHLDSFMTIGMRDVLQALQGGDARSVFYHTVRLCTDFHLLGFGPYEGRRLDDRIFRYNRSEAKKAGARERLENARRLHSKNPEWTLTQILEVVRATWNKSHPDKLIKKVEYLQKRITWAMVRRET